MIYLVFFEGNIKPEVGFHQSYILSEFLEIEIGSPVWCIEDNFLHAARNFIEDPKNKNRIMEKVFPTRPGSFEYIDVRSIKEFYKV